MAKELLLYNTIYEYTAERLISQMDEYSSEDISIRVNCPGGNPISCFGILAKMKESQKEISLKVDGAAYSMAAFMACYADKVTALDVSDFMFHRAAFSARYEMEMDANDQKQLINVNKHLREAFESKVDVAKFESISGVTVDDMFSTESRIDVHLNAKEALEVGLIDSIESIQPKELAALHSNFYGKMAAEYKPQEKEQKLKIQKMDINKLKSEHPELFAQVQDSAITAERDRVGALLAYIDADVELVTKGIKDGISLTQTMQAELGRKLFAKGEIDKLEDDSSGDVQTKKEEDKKLTKEQELEAFSKSVSDKFKKD